MMCMLWFDKFFEFFCKKIVKLQFWWNTCFNLTSFFVNKSIMNTMSLGKIHVAIWRVFLNCWIWWYESYAIIQIMSIMHIKWMRNKATLVSFIKSAICMLCTVSPFCYALSCLRRVWHCTKNRFLAIKADHTLIYQADHFDCCWGIDVIVGLNAKWFILFQRYFFIPPYSFFVQ